MHAKRFGLSGGTESRRTRAPLRLSFFSRHFGSMHPAIALLGNRSVTFALYDYHLRGVSARELATAYSLPLSWVEERLEAVRLCVKYQVKLSLHAPHTPAPAQQLVA